MNVNEITSIIERLETLPYKCVFFDGIWGIGKSYAADQIKNRETVIRISLSGLKSADDIYAEILDAYIGKFGFSNVVEKVAVIANKIASSFEKTKIAAEVLSDVTSSFLSDKTSLRMIFDKSKKQSIIVVDDFERIWDGIDITEVFRVIEFLTTQKKVKVSMIGDLTKLPEAIADKFDKYSERYIDKIYKITDIPEKINWNKEPLCIDEGFITEFRELHHFENLRSVAKANNFYKDIQGAIINKSKIITFNSERFWNELRMTAFSIVIESIDGLKLKEMQKHEDYEKKIKICASYQNN